MEIQHNSEVPIYRVIDRFWDGEHLHEPEDDDENYLIEWEFEPNAALEPMNAAARSRSLAWIQSQEDGKANRDLGDIVYEQMKNRPRELTSPELIAAAEMIKASADRKKNLLPEEKRAPAIRIPSKPDEPPPLMTGGEVARRARIAGDEPMRKTKVIRQKKAPNMRVRRVATYSTATDIGQND